jgi:hypothetical protein
MFCCFCVVGFFAKRRSLIWLVNVARNWKHRFSFPYRVELVHGVVYPFCRLILEDTMFVNKSHFCFRRIHLTQC